MSNSLGEHFSDHPPLDRPHPFYRFLDIAGIKFAECGSAILVDEKGCLRRASTTLSFLFRSITEFSNRQLEQSTRSQFGTFFRENNVHRRVEKRQVTFARA